MVEHGYHGLQSREGKVVVRPLLEKGTEPETKDENGQMPLLRAPWEGQEAFVKLLLITGDIYANSKDKDGPLSP
jgi:ankyrin repeat protein